MFAFTHGQLRGFEGDPFASRCHIHVHEPEKSTLTLVPEEKVIIKKVREPKKYRPGERLLAKITAQEKKAKKKKVRWSENDIDRITAACSRVISELSVSTKL